MILKVLVLANFKVPTNRYVPQCASPGRVISLPARARLQLLSPCRLAPNEAFHELPKFHNFEAANFYDVPTIAAMTGQNLFLEFSPFAFCCRFTLIIQRTFSKSSREHKIFLAAKSPNDIYRLKYFDAVTVADFDFVWLLVMKEFLTE